MKVGWITYAATAVANTPNTKSTTPKNLMVNQSSFQPLDYVQVIRGDSSSSNTDFFLAVERLERKGRKGRKGMVRDECPLALALA